MSRLPPDPGALLPPLAAAWPGVRLGADIASIPAIAESVEKFGQRFLQRLFTTAELDYCNTASGVDPGRLAARFAAKEAVIKALDLSESGVSWRDIEVLRKPGGGCAIRLTGMLACQHEIHDSSEFPASLSHDADYAIALVAFPPSFT